MRYHNGDPCHYRSYRKYCAVCRFRREADREVNRAEGALAENIDTETATKHLLILNKKIKDAATTTGDVTLQSLCESCHTLAIELLGALDKVKVKRGQQKWKSITKALRSVWSKEEIEDLERRLARFKAELGLHLTADLR